MLVSPSSIQSQKQQAKNYWNELMDHILSPYR